MVNRKSKFYQLVKTNYRKEFKNVRKTWKSKGSTAAYWERLYKRINRSKKPHTARYEVKIIMSHVSGENSAFYARESLKLESGYKTMYDERQEHGPHSDQTLYEYYKDVANAAEDVIGFDIEKRRRQMTIAGTNHESQIFKKANDYCDNCSALFVCCQFKKISEKAYKSKEWTEMKLRTDLPLKLSKYTNIHYFNNKDNCVKNLLKSVTPKNLHQIIDNIGNENGISISELVDFCEKYEIPIKVLDNNEKVMYVSEVSDSTKKFIYIMCHNNHAYYFSNGEPKKIAPKNKTVKIVNNIDNLLKKNIDDNIEPYDYEIADFKVDKIKLLSFTVDNIKYIQNRQYNIVLEILKKFDCERYIYSGCNVKNIPSMISKKYVMSDVSSVFPNLATFKSSAILYKNKNINNNKVINSQDMNKAFASGLMNLEYLLKCDWRVQKIHKHVDHITDSNLYIIKCIDTDKMHMIFLNSCRLYTGYTLKKFDEYNMKYKIVEEIACEIEPNYYKDMLIDMINIIKYDTVIDGDKYALKKMINVFIGQMIMDCETVSKYKIKGLYNKDESDRKNGFVSKIDENNSFIYDTVESVSHVRNNLPIHTQILNDVAIRTFERIQECGIKYENLVSIKSDCISWYDNSNKKYTYSDKIGEFKECKYNELECRIDNFNSERETATFYVTNAFTEDSHISRKFYDIYPGSGKTYQMKHKYLKEVAEEHPKEYIVLGTDHKYIKPYIDAGYVADVITAYGYGLKSIAKYNYIFIDEYEMIGGNVLNDFIYSISQRHVNMLCIGDQFQLLPVGGKPIFTKHYLNYLFNDMEIPKELQHNHRNNFSHLYYEHLIHDRYDNVKEIQKWSAKSPYDAEMCIAYTNKTCDIMNERILKHSGKNRFDIGVRYICKVNNFLKNGMCNGDEITIKNKIDNKIVLSNDVKVTEKQLSNSKLFTLGWCETVHKAQGTTLSSYYFCPEDFKYFYVWDNETKNRYTYEIISRLRQ